SMSAPPTPSTANDERGQTWTEDRPEHAIKTERELCSEQTINQRSAAPQFRSYRWSRSGYAGLGGACQIPLAPAGRRRNHGAMASRSSKTSVRKEAAAFVFGLVIACTPGCYSYAYHGRSFVSPHDKLPIDAQRPMADTRWSLFWGLKQNEWTPAPECEDKGAGRAEVKLVWYSVRLMVLTLGMAVPSRVTFYCATEEAPHEGP